MIKNIASTAKAHTFGIVTAFGLALIGGLIVATSDAATTSLSAEAESGNVTAPAAKVVAGSNSMVSGGSYVQFGSGTSQPPPPPAGGATAPNLKVAYVGDTVLSTTTKSLLSLIKNEGAELLVHLGDFDYTNNPTNWDAQTTSILGANFPQIAVVGNHDDNTTGYQAVMNARLAKTPDVKCTGNTGVQMECLYKGLRVIGTAPGLVGTGHDAYIKSKLAASNSIWNICAWHVNMKAMQAGGKGDDAGWGVYEECRIGGGIPVAGHEHSYARTKTLSNMATQAVDPTCANPAIVCVAKGKTFSTVNGLGGRGPIDPQSRCTPTVYPYGCKGEWAKFHTSSQGAVASALFVTYNVDNNPNKARGYLKDIAGKTVETFDIIRQ